MKRRYKLIIIIIIGAILTILINKTVIKNKVTLVSIGDSFSLAATPYNVAGTSFSDYLKEMYEDNNELEGYNNEFAMNHLTIHELNNYLEKNILGTNSRVPIKQTLAKAEVITIAIGIDEIASISLEQNINEYIINNYLEEMEMLLQSIREFSDKNIVLIGLYPANKFDKNDAITVNKELNKLCGKYKVHFLDILAESLQEENYFSKDSYYMNYKAHKKIANMLYKVYK